MADDKARASSSDGLGDVDSFNKAALKAVSVACKLSNGLPSENKADHDYYSSFAGFRTVMDACTARLVALLFIENCNIISNYCIVFHLNIS